MEFIHKRAWGEREGVILFTTEGTEGTEDRSLEYSSSFRRVLEWLENEISRLPSYSRIAG